MPARQGSSRRIRVVVLFVLFVILGLFVYSRFTAYHDLTQLRDGGVGTTGTITGLDSLRHTVSYKFTAFNITYTGTDSVSAGDGNPPYDALHIGGSIGVTYDPADPRISATGNPAFRVVGLETGIGITSGAVVILGLAGIYAYFFIGGDKGVSVWKR